MRWKNKFRYIYLFHKWINKLLPEENAERWQGPPHINKVKQYEIVFSFKVSLFIHFIHSWTQREFVYLVCIDSSLHYAALL